MDIKKITKNWPAFSHPDNTTYCLAHLSSQVVTYQFDKTNLKNNNRNFKVVVSYGMHCFAKDYSQQTDVVAESLMYHGPFESRPFCAVRYSYSLQLPEIVEALGDESRKDVVFSFYKEKGYAAYKGYTQDGGEISYKVGVNIFKAGKNLHMHIISAYPLGSVEKVKTTSFEAALKHARLGKDRIKPGAQK